MKKWYKVTTSYQGQSGDKLHYLESAAVAKKLMRDTPFTATAVLATEEEIDALPYQRRAFAEASVEELVGALRKRGFKVTLS